MVSPNQIDVVRLSNFHAFVLTRITFFYLIQQKCPSDHRYFATPKHLARTVFYLPDLRRALKLVLISTYAHTPRFWLAAEMKHTTSLGDKRLKSSQAIPDSSILNSMDGRLLPSGPALPNPMALTNGLSAKVTAFPEPIIYAHPLLPFINDPSLIHRM